MSMALVVNHERRPCAPVHPGRARHLLTRGRAAVYRRYPFTIILTAGERVEAADPPRLKIDPGSKTTGLAVVSDATGQVVWAAELAHRGEQVKARLDQRRACRRSRRQRHTRYRQPRFFNRRRRTGWLPALVGVAHQQHAHLGASPVALVSGRRHQPRAREIRHAEDGESQISGVEYQQGTLEGYEIRESCSKSLGGSARTAKRATSPCRSSTSSPRSAMAESRSNLTIACKP